jgi:hypothetical protein
MGKEHEEYVAQIFKWAFGKRSRSSGASFHDPIDVTTEVSVIECEATEKKSYSLKLSFWKEVFNKQHSDRIPMLAIRFRDPTGGKNTDLAVVSLHDLSAMMEELEVYRREVYNGSFQ